MKIPEINILSLIEIDENTPVYQKRLSSNKLFGITKKTERFLLKFEFRHFSIVTKITFDLDLYFQTS